MKIFYFHSNNSCHLSILKLRHTFHVMWWLLLSPLIATVNSQAPIFEPLPAPEYTGEAGKCVMSWTEKDGCGKNPRLKLLSTDDSLPDPDLGLMDDSGRQCILNNGTMKDDGPNFPNVEAILELVGPNAAPCYEPEGVEPEAPGRPLNNLLNKICPEFAANHEKTCCSFDMMNDFDKKFNKMYKGFFQACPACMKSQLEYYCNLYCHPEQSDFITVNNVFNSTNNSPNSGVDHFTAALPAAYTDDLYKTCKTVKFTWFVNTPCINDLIPTDGLARNLVSDRFCRDVGTKGCSASVWLNAQGQAITEWPRFGTLNNIISGTQGPTGHVYSCSEDLKPIYAAPGVDSDSPVECGCQNCADSCPISEEIDLQDPYHIDQIDRSFGKCLFKPTCGPNYLIPNGDGLNRPDVPCVAYNRPAYEWRDENEGDRVFLERLYDVCPRYLNNSLDGSHTVTCCDSVQMSTLRDQVSQLRQLFGRCPACVENAINVFCHSTCAPDQAAFLDPISGFNTVDQEGNDAIGINRVNVYIEKEYGDRLWESCKDVNFPQTNGKVIEGLMCDGQVGDDCNVLTWLNFQGSTSNGFSPLTYNYISVDMGTKSTELEFQNRWKKPKGLEHLPESQVPNGAIPKTYQTFACQTEYTDPYSGVSGTCSCQDCEAVCPGLYEYPEPEAPPTIGVMEKWAFIGMMIGIMLVISVITFLVVRKAIKNCVKDDQVYRQDSKLLIKFPKHLSRINDVRRSFLYKF